MRSNQHEDERGAVSERRRSQGYPSDSDSSAGLDDGIWGTGARPHHMELLSFLHFVIIFFAFAATLKSSSCRSCGRRVYLYANDVRHSAHLRARWPGRETCTATRKPVLTGAPQSHWAQVPKLEPLRDGPEMDGCRNGKRHDDAAVLAVHSPIATCCSTRRW